MLIPGISIAVVDPTSYQRWLTEIISITGCLRSLKRVLNTVFGRKPGMLPRCNIEFRTKETRVYLQRRDENVKGENVSSKDNKMWAYPEVKQNMVQSMI